MPEGKRWLKRALSLAALAICILASPAEAGTGRKRLIRRRRTSDGANRKEIEPRGRNGVLRAEDDGRTAALLTPTGYEHHASQLLLYYRADDGPEDWTLLCAWFSGVEGEGTVSIMVSALRRGSDRWEQPVQAALQKGRSLQNPTWLWDSRSDRILLMFTSQQGKNQGTSSVQAVASSDGGATWDPPQVLLEERGAFLKNHPLRSFDGGRWLLPMYYTPKGMSHIPSQYSAVRTSADGGQTWSEDAPMTHLGSGLVQPSVVRMPPSEPLGGPPRLVAFFRSRNRDYVWRAESADDGQTWSEANRTVLPNNNKAVQAIHLGNGTLALIFNNNRGSSVGRIPGTIRRYKDSRQHPLSIGISTDGGHTWPVIRDLEPHFDKGLEYTYPSVVRTPDGDLHVTYSYSSGRRRVAVRYLRFSIDWIRGTWPDGSSTRGLHRPGAAGHEAGREGRLRSGRRESRGWAPRATRDLI